MKGTIRAIAVSLLLCSVVAFAGSDYVTVHREVLAAAEQGDAARSSISLDRFEWSGPIQPGTSESDLTTLLLGLGIAYRKGGAGLTYSSMVSAGDIDYLFCDNRLIAMIQGRWATGREFNKWFELFLRSHETHGEPAKYKAWGGGWGRFEARWKLDNGDTLVFMLQSDGESLQGWSRQLYAERVGAPCASNE